MQMLSLLAVSLAALVGLASTFTVSPPVAPYFGPGGPFYPGAFGGLGLGLGLGGLGGLGGIGLGLGGLGGLGLLGSLGPLGLTGLGFGLGSFGPGGNARLGGIRGRRSLDLLLHGEKKDHGEIKCDLSRNLLNCVGPHEIVQCEVKSLVKLPIEIGHFKLNDLELTLREKVVNNVETIKISPKNANHRMGHKLESLSIFESDKLAETQTGFWIKDFACFNDVLTLVKELPDKITLTLKDSITSD